jgi:hypothetical protein
MLCQFNPVKNTYTKLFPLSAFGPNVERLRNGVYVRGTPGASSLSAGRSMRLPVSYCGVVPCVSCRADALGEGLIVDVTTRFKTINIVRIDLNTHKKVQPFAHRLPHQPTRSERRNTTRHDTHDTRYRSGKSR